MLPQASQHSITVRAPKPVLDAAACFIENLDQGAPQVMLDLQAFEINPSMTRTLGFNFPPASRSSTFPRCWLRLTSNSRHAGA